MFYTNVTMQETSGLAIFLRLPFSSGLYSNNLRRESCLLTKWYQQTHLMFTIAIAKFLTIAFDYLPSKVPPSLTLVCSATENIRDTAKTDTKAMHSYNSGPDKAIGLPPRHSSRFLYICLHTEKFITCTMSVSWQNWRHRQSLVIHGKIKGSCKK